MGNNQFILYYIIQETFVIVMRQSNVGILRNYYFLDLNLASFMCLILG